LVAAAISFWEPATAFFWQTLISSLSSLAYDEFVQL
jgi:hypothetical protein